MAKDENIYFLLFIEVKKALTQELTMRYPNFEVVHE